MNNFIRSSGHPKTAMATQFIGAFLNLTVAPITIFVLNWGMRGAAAAHGMRAGGIFCLDFAVLFGPAQPV